jgi:pantoate--beta-alanine ligase
MIVLHAVSDVREHLNDQRASGRTIGMVGTSGSLHEGHLSLVRRAKADNDVAVMFWSGGLDLEWAKGSSPSYSPDMERDLALVEASGLDVFFSLNRADLYTEPSSTFISLPSFAEAPGRLEDPEHLKIVATMVTTFCSIAGPCRSYFGEKDWQQLAMLQKMVQDLHLPYEIIACPTVRESDGVAISSRNQKLTREERLAAPILYRGLQIAADAVAAGVLDAEKVAVVFTDAVKRSASVDYVKVVDARTLMPVREITGNSRVLVSASFGNVRLVDNIGVRPSKIGPGPGTIPVSPIQSFEQKEDCDET